jgi:hypothetical protein
MSDARSPLVIRIIDANPNAYSALVVHGSAPTIATDLLKDVQPAQLLTKPVTSPDTANAMLAALWLWHDALDESHHISQKIETPDGSYWHAIMHRREGDFSNAKYWLARCRNHPVAPAIAEQLPAVIAGRSSDSLVGRLSGNGGWDPFAFVDLAEDVHDRPDDPRHALAVAVQRLEWRALFDHCAARA